MTTKNTNSFGYDSFQTNFKEGKFIIAYENNLDLYWYFFPKDSIKNLKESYSVIIDETNPYLLEGLRNLYNAVISNKPYQNNELADEELQNKEYQGRLPKELLDSKDIVWYSDDNPIEEASYVRIKKVDGDTFILTFNKSHSKLQMDTHSIRITNSGSRHAPFNFTFMGMYSYLRQVDINQITIKEYLAHQKTLQRIKWRCLFSSFFLV